MIEKLTEAQEAAIPKYVDKWTKIGLSTDQLELGQVEEIVHTFQKNALDTEPTPVHLFQSPISAWNKVCDLCEITEEDRKNFIYPFLDGSFSAGTFAYYDFFIEECGIELTAELLKKWHAWKETSKLGLVYVFPEFVVASQKPTAIHRNEFGLHGDGVPALQYGEEFKMWYLNGVSVPQYLAETPAEDLDVEFFNKEQNADVKAEFIRKYGVERLLEKGKLVDTHENYKKEWWTKSGYELFDMKEHFPNIDVDRVLFLKMVNQTTGIFHVEAVSPGCDTIEKALRERFGGDYEIADIK